MANKNAALEKKAADQKAAAEKKAAAERKKAADQKAAAEKKAAAERQKKAAAERQKKAPLDKKSALANQVTSEKKREQRTQLLTVSVYLNTGKIAGFVSLGVIASALLVSVLSFIAR